jgi:uncharacterized protein (DUF1499 family)
MRLLPLLVGLLMPACAQEGVGGLPPAAPIDFASLTRPATPNTALAAPAGFSPTPDIVTHPYKLAAPALLAAMQRVAAAEPRTYPQATFADRLQADYVVRSAVFNFPDLVTVQTAPVTTDPASSTLIIWSRSVYGHSDLGVNRKRVAAWIATLDSDLSRSQP